MYDKLRGRLVEEGFSQKEVAEKLGICEHTLGMKLNGKREFKISEILALARLLDIECPIADEFLP